MWNKAIPNGGIYSSYLEDPQRGWIGGESIDPSLETIANSNPAVTALRESPEPPSCGDGALEASEQCDGVDSGSCGSGKYLSPMCTCISS